jgi:hypothetical protein
VTRRIAPRRGKSGGCVIRLTSAERALLAKLPKELEEVLSAMDAGGIGSVEAGVGGDVIIGSAPEPLEGSEGEGSTAFPPVEGIGVIPPSLKRLFPPAYTGDDDAERAYVALARADLLDHHRRALQMLSETASAKSLDEEQLHGWATALNDVRLVLGTVLDIREDSEVPEGPVSPQLLAYYYLSGLQGEIVEYLSESLPEALPGADDQIPEDPWGEPLGGLRWDGTPQPGSEP